MGLLVVAVQIHSHSIDMNNVKNKASVWCALDKNHFSSRRIIRFESNIDLYTVQNDILPRVEIHAEIICIQDSIPLNFGAVVCQ
jgi:hypothetical protein